MISVLKKNTSYHRSKRGVTTISPTKQSLERSSTVGATSPSVVAKINLWYFRPMLASWQRGNPYIRKRSLLPRSFGFLGPQKMLI